MRPSRLLIAGALALAASGCVEPEDKPLDWNYIHATIIEPHCATIGCHSHATQEGRAVPLDMSTPKGACDSLTDEVLTLLRGEGQDDEYPQMPPDIPLADPEIDLVARWFAQENPSCE